MYDGIQAYDGVKVKFDIFKFVDNSTNPNLAEFRISGQFLLHFSVHLR